MLSGCAGYQPKDIFAQSRGWLEKTSDQLEALSSPANNVNYDDEVEALLAQPYIDPLTDYINQHSGLGLHLVYNIVTQKLNGTIKCESEENQGTKFMISLPIEPK